MRHFIRSAIVGIALSLTSVAAERGANSPDIGYEPLGQNEQRESILINIENPNAPLLNNQEDDQESSSFEEERASARSILPLCLAQIVGKTRLCYMLSSLGIPVEQRSDADHASNFLNSFCFAGGFTGLTVGGIMLGIHGISPFSLGLTISGAVLSTPHVVATVSELMYRCAPFIGKDEFVQDADDVRDVPCCLPNWSGHLELGSINTKRWLSWFCTPCCGPTTLNEDLL